MAVVRDVHPGGRGARPGLLAGDIFATCDLRASVDGRIELPITRDGVMRALREE